MLYNSSHLTSRRNGANEIHLFCGALKDLTDLHLNTVKDPLSQLYSGPLKGYLIFLESLQHLDDLADYEAANIPTRWKCGSVPDSSSDG